MPCRPLCFFLATRKRMGRRRVVHLIGGELVLTLEDAQDMMKAAELPGSPVGPIRVRQGAKSKISLAIYVIPKAE